MVPTFGRTIRLVSRVICVIVILWFAVFAIDQTKSASGHQQQELKGQTASEARQEEADRRAQEKKKSGLHEGLDETAGRPAGMAVNVNVGDTATNEIEVLSLH